MSLRGLIIPGATPTFQTANNESWAEPGNEATDTFSAPYTDNISYMCVYTKIAHENRVSDQLSDGLIFGRLFQANENFSTH